MTGVLKPTSSEIGYLIVMIFVVCLDHEMFHLVAGLLLSKSVFDRGLKLPH